MDEFGETSTVVSGCSSARVGRAVPAIAVVTSKSPTARRAVAKMECKMISKVNVG
jgi:hypothetical protein